MPSATSPSHRRFCASSAATTAPSPFSGRVSSRRARSVPPAMYSTTKPSHVGSVVTTPSTWTTRGLRSLTMIASSVAKAFSSFARAAAAEPTSDTRLSATTSPWNSARCTVPWPPRAKGSGSQESSSTSYCASARSLSWRASALPAAAPCLASVVRRISSRSAACCAFWLMTMPTPSASLSSLSPRPSSSSRSTADPRSMPHTSAARRAAASLFASTACWPRSWMSDSIFWKRCVWSASCWRSSADPSSALRSQSRLSRSAKFRASSVPEQSFAKAPFSANFLRNAPASLSAAASAPTVRDTASTRPVGRPAVARTTSSSFCAISKPRRRRRPASSLLKRTRRAATASSARACVNG
mmetsp:Transcript_14242/g.49044  ORF Transcript_14242/g.49044 Transcript_14242/m.49044 type:complete len:356 (+) Transcript_14242:816-1883(+)